MTIRLIILVNIFAVAGNIYGQNTYKWATEPRIKALIIFRFFIYGERKLTFR